MTAYKLFRIRKDGSLGPLFIDATLRITPGEWLTAKLGKPPKKTWKVRAGWHCCTAPYAPHLNSQITARVWCQVEIMETTVLPRHARLGGDWVLAEKMRVLRVLDPAEVASLRPAGV